MSEPVKRYFGPTEEQQVSSDSRTAVHHLLVLHDRRSKIPTSNSRATHHQTKCILSLVSVEMGAGALWSSLRRLYKCYDGVFFHSENLSPLGLVAKCEKSRPPWGGGYLTYSKAPLIGTGNFRKSPLEGGYLSLNNDDQKRDLFLITGGRSHYKL